MSAPDLAALVDHYQKQLRLQDWRIDVSYAPDLRDAAGRQVWGLCSRIAEAKVARIIIRDPSTPPEGVTPADALRQVVETVVHELVHLHFAAFGNRSPEAVVAEEQAVWALADALITSRDTPQEQSIARAMVAQISALSPARAEPQVERTAVAEGGIPMDPKLAAEALDALTAGDTNKCAEILKGILVAAAAGGEAPAPAPEEPMPAEAAAEPPPEDKQPMAARLVTLEADDERALGKIALSLVGETSAGAAAPKLARALAVAKDLEKREADLTRARAALETSERRDLVARLVVAGEQPGTAWARDANGLPDGKTPAEPWASMPIAALRSRVSSLSSSRPNAGPRPPTSEPAEFTSRERAMLAAKKIDPVKYADIRARIAARSARPSGQGV